MKKLFITVAYNIKGDLLQGYTGDIELSNNDDLDVDTNELGNFDRLASFMGELYMSDKQADTMEDIFAESGSMTEALKKLEKAGIIQDYEIKNEEE